VTVATGWQAVEFLTDAGAWRGGVNRVDLDFDWDRRPIDVGASGDARSLAAAVDYVRVVVPAAGPG
jgi:hypothetical protein